MVKTDNRTTSLSFFSSLILGIGLVAFGAIGYFVYAEFIDQPPVSSDGSTVLLTPVNSQNIPPTILKPAVVQSRVDECSTNLSYASNGNISPIQCSDGSLNILAWKALSALEPKVMKLGYSPTLAQLQTALCDDANDADVDSNSSITLPLETSIYQISSLYYGWHFSINVANVLAHDCGPNTGQQLTYDFR
jgi:hypothetical protein